MNVGVIELRDRFTPYADRAAAPLRMRLDPIYETELRALQVAGADWKQNISHAWRGFDKRETRAATRRQYLKLRSMLWGWYAEKADALAEAHPEYFQDEEERQEYRARLVGDKLVRNTLKADGIDADLSDMVA